MKENNVELLRLLGLPVFLNTADLAQKTHLDRKRLNSLVMRNNQFYKKHYILKKSGGLREINQPNLNQKAIQAWILRNILDKLTISEHATAFIKNKGLIQNIVPHLNNRYFLCLDIKDFFDSIKFKTVYNIFFTIGYSTRVSWALSKLCTYDSKLPQGGITSPALSNIAAFPLDRRISGYLSRKNVAYTRYADDLTFSASNPKILRQIYPALLEIVKTSGFEVNAQKTRFSGHYNKTVVTGLIKDCSTPKFGIGSKRKRVLRSMIHKHFSNGFYNKKQEKVILGWLSFYKSIDQVGYQNMMEYYNSQKLKFKYT